MCAHTLHAPRLPTFLKVLASLTSHIREVLGDEYGEGYLHACLHAYSYNAEQVGKRAGGRGWGLDRSLGRSLGQGQGPGARDRAEDSRDRTEGGKGQGGGRRVRDAWEGGGLGYRGGLVTGGRGMGIRGGRRSDLLHVWLHSFTSQCYYHFQVCSSSPQQPVQSWFPCGPCSPGFPRAHAVMVSHAAHAGA